MKLHELREALASKTAEMRSLLDTANGELGDEAKKRFDTLETECRGLNERIARETRVAEMERQAEATTLNGGTPDFDRECRSYSLLRAIAGASGMPGVDAARELEISQEIAHRTGRTPQGIFAPTEIFQSEQRVLLSGTTGAGAIGTDHRDDQLVDTLRAASIVDRLGATVLSGLQGNVSIPAVDTGASSAWIAENGALSPADFDINSRTLTPKHVGALTEFSRNMILQSSPDVENLARSDFARALAAALDSAALIGGGANEPDGIVTQLIAGPGLSTFATPTWAEGLQMIADVETANAAEGRLGWALHPQVVKKLRSTVRVSTTDSRFIMDEPSSLFGYPALASTGLTLGSPAVGPAIFGDFSSLVVGYWSGVDILANPFESTAYSKGNVQVRGLLSADVAIRHIESFEAALDMDTA